MHSEKKKAKLKSGYQTIVVSSTSGYFAAQNVKMKRKSNKAKLSPCVLH